MSKTISTKGMSEEAWLKQRRSSIGGSDAAALLGKSKYNSPLDVYLSKTGEDEPFTGNKHTRYGHLMEPVIAGVFAEDTGCTVHKCHRMVIDGEYEHIHANIDRQIIASGPEESTGILECKATQPQVVNNWVYDINPSWYIQLQHYLMIFGYEYGYISYESNREFTHLRFEADPDLQQFLRDEYKKFWEDHVLAGVPPEGNPEGVDEVLKPIEGKVSEVEDDEIFDMYLELMATREERLELSKKEDRLKDSLKLIVGDAEKLVYEGDVLASQSYNERFYTKNTDEFQEKHPELFDKYIRKSGYTRTHFRKP